MIGRRMYLETSSIMAAREDVLARALEVCSPITSVFVLIELLPPLRCSEREYGRHRAALLRLRNQNIEVDLRWPEQLMGHTFDAVKSEYSFDERRRESLQSLLGLLVRSKTQKEWERGQGTLTFDVEYFEGHRRWLSDTFIAASRDHNREIRAAFDAGQSRAGKPGSGKRWPGTFASFLRLYNDTKAGWNLNRFASIYALARSVQSMCDRNGDEEFFNQLLNSYNGKLNAWVEVMALNSIDLAAEDRLPRPNDAPDFVHMMYVNETMGLITDDRLLRRYTTALGLPVRSVREMHGMASLVSPDMP